jgi:hypothetical protein
MELIPQEVCLKDILLDPYNPRFITQGSEDQQQLLKNLLGKKYVKDLLRSMQIDIKWINRIVLQKIDTHEHFSKFNGQSRYIVVEGNTRTACLKSNKIDGITEDSKIPILFAKQTKGESLVEFQKEVRITQGIANVTVVKEWDPISKAMHLRKLYDGFSKKHPDYRPPQLYKLIADELGKTVHEVRQSIIRYTIYSKISEISDTIPEEKFGYLEAFEKNTEIRQVFGMNPNTNEIEFNDENDELKEELLEKVPELIRKAANQGINTKQFRDLLHTKLTQDTEEVLNLFNDLIDDENSITFHALMKDNVSTNLREEWESKINRIFDEISGYPLVEDWAKDDLVSLNNIKLKLDRIVTFLNENK